MKKALLLLAALLTSYLSYAQTTDRQRQYSEESARLFRTYREQPDNVYNLLLMAHFYRDPQNPMRNFALAYKYVCGAEERYVAIVGNRSSYRELKGLLRKGVTIDSLRTVKRQVEQGTIGYVQHTATLSQTELQSLHDAFRGVPSVQDAIECRNIGESYTDLRNENSMERLKAFVEKYRGSSEANEVSRQMTRMADSIFRQASTEEEVDDLLRGYEDFEGIVRQAKKRKATLAYAHAVESHTEAAYRAFLSQHPYADEYDDALDQLESLLASQYASLRTPQELSLFVQRNPNSPLSEKALERLRYMVGEERDQRAARIYFDNFPLDAEYANLYRRYYGWHAQDGSSDPIVRFQSANPRFPYMTSIPEDIRQALGCDSINLLRPYNEAQFLDWAQDVRRLTGKDISFVALQRTLQPLITARNWKACLERMDYFLLSFDEVCVQECADLRALFNAPANSGRQLTTEVTPSYIMRDAALHPDGQHLFFTMQKEGKSTICVAQRANAKGYRWKSIGPLRFDNLANEGLRFYSLYDNGRRMLLGQAGDILIAEFQDSLWHVVEIPTYPVNTDYEDYDAFMLPDGSGMLLASDRPYGHNYQQSGAYYHGDTALASDIYFVPRSLYGWGEAVNLGCQVNTPYCDHSPLLSGDLKTLYFISDGHAGLGFGDVYYCTRTDIDDWTSWSKPVNYGKETNSAFREERITLSPDERSLYLCTLNGSRSGLYSVAAAHTPTVKVLPMTLSAASETVVDIIDLGSQALVTEVTVPADYEPVSVSLYQEKRYVVLPHGQTLRYVSAQPLVPRAGKAIELREYTPDAAPQGPQPLGAVTFEKGSATLTAVACRELENMAEYLVANPDISKVYLSVNVPGGDDQQCFDLSRARAVALRRHLEQHGVAAARLIVTAYGNVNYQAGATRPTAEVEFLW